MRYGIKLDPDFAKTIDKLGVGVGDVIRDKLNGAPKKTKVIIRNGSTGEILGEYHNKIVFTGSMLNALMAWGIESSVEIPTYNSEMGFDNDADPSDPKGPKLIRLFCMDDSGCGAMPKDVMVASYTDRIKPVEDYEDPGQDHIMAFQYSEADIEDELRNVYFGRKTLENGKIAYYFKAFDSTPQLFMKYADGTEITSDVYKIDSDQIAEVYVETKLVVTRDDFRDYFDQLLGWDNARVSSLSLCYGWESVGEDGYTYYQDIMPYSKLNFSFEWLVDLTKSLEFQYQVYY